MNLLVTPIKLVLPKWVGMFPFLVCVCVFYGPRLYWSIKTLKKNLIFHETIYITVLSIQYYNVVPQFGAKKCIKTIKINVVEQ